MPNTIVFSSIASTYAFWPSVFGRMLLPRDVRIAWPSTSAGLPLVRARGCALEEVTSAGPRSAPLRTICEQLLDERLARRATCSPAPSRVISLPRTARRRRDTGARSSSAAGPAGRAAAPSRRRRPAARRASTRRRRAVVSQPRVPSVEAAAEHVGVHVEDGLTGARAGVEDEPEVAVGVLGGERLRATDDDLGEQRRGRRRRARRRCGTPRSSGPRAGAPAPSARCRGRR